jgi:O-antigen ligase
VRLKYARWQGLVAAASMVAFIALTGWRYPGIALGIGIGLILVMKGGERVVRRLATRERD